MYVLPSMDEWYKAAFYDPVNDVYYDYPTGSNTVPTAVASGTTAGTAVYDQSFGPADITLAGGLSPYGIMGMGGNVYEVDETAYDLDNSSGSENRGWRGGHWDSNSDYIDNTIRGAFRPSREYDIVGFRVARVFPAPEPGSMALLLAGAFVFGYRRWRR